MTTWVRTVHSVQLLDQRILRRAAQFRGPVLDALMRGFTRLGDWQSWTTLALGAMLAGGELRHVALRVLPRLLATLLLCKGVKGLSRRPRPMKTLSGFSALLKDPDPYSFPSAHSACAWAACLAAASALGAGWALLIPMAIAISYSRIHVGAHYPLDVLIGTLIGATFGLL